METNRLPPLRVLIVEDSEDDAELLLRKLRQGGYEPLHTRVETAEDMGAALSLGPWDLIISDYRLPRFSGLQALALLRGTGLDVPFLIVSGNIGEDTAVETMKAGAHDYIMKDRLQRLVPAIRRELKDAEERRLRRQTEKALVESEVQYRELVARMSSAVVVYKVNEDGSDFIIADFNPAGERIEQIRKADIVGKSILDVFSGVVEFGLFAVLKRVWETGRPEHYPVSLYKDVRIAGWRENYVYKLSSGDIVAVYDDVTVQKIAEENTRQAAAELLKKHEELEVAHAELKQAQARVIQQEKMASIGQLAAGITHEINNPMSFITGNLGILKTYLEGITKIIATQEEIAGKHAPPEAMETLQALRKKMKIDYILNDVGHLIDQSLEGAERVRKIVSDLKTFSRMAEDAYMIEDINAALDSTINIVWNEIKYKTELVKEFGELPLTCCNISHLNQVFMNLLMNAAQAIEKWGKITVRTWTQGEDIYASVADTGNGIPEENQKKIFEPFYTTKAAGKGTGLGLSISYDIVKRHNGDITVESEVGKGSTFTIRIPVVR
jgi:signal transduction histidine kinase/CheY-like chemotaxis protein